MSTPNAIKIDVDGGEVAILRGAANTLRSHSLRTLLIEVDEATTQASEVTDILTGAGFTLRSKHKYRYGGTTGPFAHMFNYIFERG